MSQHDDANELTARLRAADPASSLPPVTPEGVARLLEEAMSHDLLPENRETGTHQRSRLTWLVAAAAAGIIAGAGVFAVTNRDDGTAPAPQATEPTVTELTAPSSTPARCMVPTAEVLSGQAVAFDGTVRDIEGDQVTLTPTAWFAGEPTDLVTVTAPGDAMEMLLSAVSFEEGERYLVAADEQGDVMVCGFSAPWSKDLDALYVEAFGS